MNIESKGQKCWGIVNHSLNDANFITLNGLSLSGRKDASAHGNISFGWKYGHEKFDGKSEVQIPALLWSFYEEIVKSTPVFQRQ